jgi:hypothetical protein
MRSFARFARAHRSRHRTIAGWYPPVVNDHTIRLRGGRRLGYAEWGDPRGGPLLFFHGWPGSRIEARLGDKAASVSGVRLIAIDRPGMGLSDFQPGRTLLDWPADVVQVAADRAGPFLCLGDLWWRPVRSRLRLEARGSACGYGHCERPRSCRCPRRHSWHGPLEPVELPNGGSPRRLAAGSDGRDGGLGGAPAGSRPATRRDGRGGQGVLGPAGGANDPCGQSLRSLPEREPWARLGDGTLRSPVGVSPRGNPDACARVARGGRCERSRRDGTLPRDERS